jgi:hypothetical protein
MFPLTMLGTQVGGILYLIRKFFIRSRFIIIDDDTNPPT